MKENIAQAKYRSKKLLDNDNDEMSSDDGDNECKANGGVGLSQKSLKPAENAAGKTSGLSSANISSET